jgi:hypothetical protein
LNRRPKPFQGSALPAELPHRSDALEFSRSHRLLCHFTARGQDRQPLLSSRATVLVFWTRPLQSRSRLRQYSSSERCQSGRMGRSRKPVGGLLPRGFESRPLRCSKSLKPILCWLHRLGRQATIDPGNCAKTGSIEQDLAKSIKGEILETVFDDRFDLVSGIAVGRDTI